MVGVGLHSIDFFLLRDFFYLLFVFLLKLLYNRINKFFFTFFFVLVPCSSLIAFLVLVKRNVGTIAHSAIRSIQCQDSYTFMRESLENYMTEFYAKLLRHRE